jgi:hypothetical protein
MSWAFCRPNSLILSFGTNRGAVAPNATLSLATIAVSTWEAV